MDMPRGGVEVSELEHKLRSFKIEPQSKEEALENIRKLKSNIGMLGKKSSKKEVLEILKRAGSLTEEVLESRKKERQ